MRGPAERARRLARWLRERRRALALLAAVALVSGGLVWGTGAALDSMESPAFCGQCHAMGTELIAHESSAHRNVECGQCHVGRGALDLVRSKLRGAGQLVQQLRGTYDHPAASSDTAEIAERCVECHGDRPSGQYRLVLRDHFLDDEKNTAQTVALLVRVGRTPGGESRGVHWHVDSLVQYVEGDGATVQYVRVEEPPGEVREYAPRDAALSASASRISEQALQSGDLTTMNCLSCHNRAGHELLPPGRAMDAALSDGRIDPGLPYIKAKGVELLGAAYSSTEDAMSAFDGLATYYAGSYPGVYAERLDAILRAEQGLRELYPLVANPELGLSYEDYPTLLGHRDVPGCFRCHSGDVVLLDQGGEGGEGGEHERSIPSSCITCHTFPQSGPEGTLQIMAGSPPETHTTGSWNVQHVWQAGSTSVAQTSCAACHSQSYCTNCHARGKAHGDPLFDHAAAVRSEGTGECAECHQAPSCAQCHDRDVLGATPARPATGGSPRRGGGRRRGSSAASRAATAQKTRRRSGPLR